MIALQVGDTIFSKTVPQMYGKLIEVLENGYGFIESYGRYSSGQKIYVNLNCWRKGGEQ